MDRAERIYREKRKASEKAKLHSNRKSLHALSHKDTKYENRKLRDEIRGYNDDTSFEDYCESYDEFTDYYDDRLMVS